jgi:hypothetical protein
MRKTVKRAVVVGTALALTAGGATAAWAAWNATGNGNAHAKAGTAVALETAQVSTGATLYPGVTGDSVIKVVNKNPYPVQLNTVTWAPSDGVQADIAACNNTGVYFGDFSTNTIGSNGVLNVASRTLVVPAKGSAKFELPDSVRMINNSQDECQGASFSIKVALSGVSAAN